ncbi:Fc receptor-like protein 5, partial [Clarias magur]
GDVILESPVHPVTEGNPLTLHCLYRNTNVSDSAADFYKDDSVLQKQTTGEMNISSVSKSDEGFYHCKHPERGESPKSWVSVRASRLPIVVIALSSAFALFFLMILLIVLVRSKKKKGGDEYQTPSAVILDTSQPADAAAGLSDVTYAEIELKKPKKKLGKSSKGDETMYSELKQDTDEDAAAGPSNMTYAEIVLKKLKKPKKKPGKSSVGDETVYSELKQDTDKDAAPGPSDVTSAKPELIKPKKPKKNLFFSFKGKSSEVEDNLYSEVKTNTDEDAAPGPSDVICAKPELQELRNPKENQGKSSEGDGNLYSEVKRKTDEDAAPGPSDATSTNPEPIKPKKPKIFFFYAFKGKSSEGEDNLSSVKTNTDEDAAPGPSDVTCAKPELQELLTPKENQGKNSKGDANLYSEVKKKTDEDAAPGPSDVTSAKPEPIKPKKPKKKIFFSFK